MLFDFYYDESSHSRKITQKTIDDEGFNNYFVAAIVGWSSSTRLSVEKAFELIEERFKSIYQVDELKSSIIKDRKYSYGLASLKADDIDFLRDYFTLLKNSNAFAYLLIDHKFEYLISQLLDAYQNQLLLDADALKYSITKYIALRRPEKVIKVIFDENADFVKELKNVLLEQRAINGDDPLREAENGFIDQALLVLEDVSNIKTLEWRYTPSFFGFSKYLDQVGIEYLRLTIDREGSGKTIQSARQMGFHMAEEADSKLVPGLRIADWMAGIASRFIKSLEAALSVKNRNAEGITLLPEKWFEIDQERFDLYQLMFDVFIQQNNAWNKFTCSSYADGPIIFVALLSHFKEMTYEEFKSLSKRKNQELFNARLAVSLSDHFTKLGNKLPLEHIRPETQSWRNHQGATVNKDPAKHQVLKIDDTPRKYLVWAVGLYPNGFPTVTIEKKGMRKLYLLPDEYVEWAMTVIGYASMGENPFPSEVEFGKINGQYYAEFLD